MAFKSKDLMVSVLPDQRIFVACPDDSHALACPDDSHAPAACPDDSHVLAVCPDDSHASPVSPELQGIGRLGLLQEQLRQTLNQFPA